MWSKGAEGDMEGLAGVYESGTGCVACSVTRFTSRAVRIYLHDDPG
jgi:hypothetical protein